MKKIRELYQQFLNGDIKDMTIRDTWGNSGRGQCHIRVTFSEHTVTVEVIDRQAKWLANPQMWIDHDFKLQTIPGISRNRNSNVKQQATIHQTRAMLQVFLDMTNPL